MAIQPLKIPLTISVKDHSFRQIPTAILLHGWRLKKGEKGFGSVKVSRGGNLQGVSLFPNLSMSG